MPSSVIDLTAVLGLDQPAEALTFLQISLRGVIVFVAALVVVRCGDLRVLSQKTAFDVERNGHISVVTKEHSGQRPTSARSAIV